MPEKTKGKRVRLPSQDADVLSAARILKVASDTTLPSFRPGGPMITAVNIPDRLAQHENGQMVPLAFLKGNDPVDDWEEADAIMVGPWYEWSDEKKKFEKKFAKIERDALDLGE